MRGVYGKNTRPDNYHYDNTGFYYATRFNILLHIDIIMKELRPAEQCDSCLSYLGSPWTIYRENGNFMKVCKSCNKELTGWELPE